MCLSDDPSCREVAFFRLDVGKHHFMSTPEPLLLVPPRPVRPVPVDLPAPPCHPLEADHPAAGGAAAGAGGGRPGGVPADEAHQEGNGHQVAGRSVLDG